MEASEFAESRTGTLVPIPHKSPDAALAFVPNRLPPDWVWPTELYPLLVEARAALASLDGTGKHLPNPEIVLKPLQRREAQLSSQLEGTFTDPQKQALFEAADGLAARADDPTFDNYREVANYARALHRHAPTLPLSKRLICELHGILMEGVRGQLEQPGVFRTIQNQIGHPARFVPPPPHVLPQLLDDLEAFLHNRDAPFDPLVRAFLAHYQFETIHPFGDGNGRVGRLLLALTIAEWCNLSRQWLYMSPFFERRKKEYMDLMLRVSTHGDWALWIRFCLEGVIEQSQDTEKRCEKLLKLHRDFHQRLKGGSVRLSGIVDSLFDSPVITVANTKKKNDVTYPTARGDLKKLEKVGILSQIEGFFPITYYCPQIYNVIYQGVL